MARLTPEQILEIARANGDPIPYACLYRRRSDGLELLPEYMAYNRTRQRKRPRIDYTKFYKNPICK